MERPTPPNLGPALLNLGLTGILEAASIFGTLIHRARRP